MAGELKLLPFTAKTSSKKLSLKKKKKKVNRLETCMNNENIRLKPKQNAKNQTFSRVAK